MTSSTLGTAGKRTGGDRSLERTLYFSGLAAILVVAAAVIVTYIFRDRIPDEFFMCPVHSLTGYFCPGCGGTRAAVYLFTGQIIKSLIANPAVTYAIVIVTVFMVSMTAEILSKGKIRGMTFRYFYITIAIVLLIADLIVKNAVLYIYGTDLIEWAGTL